MRVAAYCRVSTDKSDQLNSLQAQIRFFSEFTKKEGYELIEVYADEGISGTKMKNRFEFLRLLKDAHNDLFDMVVVKDISRFARNTVDFLQSIRELKSLGIETVFLTGNMSVLGNSEFVLTIFGALAQEESANTSKRVKFGKHLNAQKGRVPNLIYGYEKTPGDYFHLEINEKEAEIVKKIFFEYTQNEIGCTRIANQLNELGLRTKRGYLWSQNAVSRILKNPIYKGQVVNGREEIADFLTGRREQKEERDWMIVQRPELAIIPEETFELAGRILKEKRQTTGPPKKGRQVSSHLYRNLIRCHSCGHFFRRIVRQYQNTYVRWVCSGHNGKGNHFCSNRLTIDEDELTEKIKQYLFSLLHSQNQWVSREWKRLLRSKIQRGGKEENRRQTELRYRLQQKKERYFSLYADDLLSRKELESAVASIQRELDQIEQDQKCDQKVQDRKKLEDWSEEGILNDWLTTLTNIQFAKIIDWIDATENGRVDVYLKRLPKTVPNPNNGT